MAGNSGIIKWQALITDKLDGFMPLASNQQNVTRPNTGQRRRDGLVAAGYFNGVWTGGNDRRADAGGIFGAWVIVGDKNLISIGVRNPPHFCTFACITVTATPKQHGKLAGGGRAQCG